MHFVQQRQNWSSNHSPAHRYSRFVSVSQGWESKLSFGLSTPIITWVTGHRLQKFIHFLSKTWMGKFTQTPFFPHPFLPIRRNICFFIRPHERLGKLFHQYSDNGSPCFLRDIVNGRRGKKKKPPQQKQPTQTPPSATRLLEIFFNDFCTEQANFIHKLTPFTIHLELSRTRKRRGTRTQRH